MYYLKFFVHTKKHMDTHSTFIEKFYNNNIKIIMVKNIKVYI